MAGAVSAPFRFVILARITKEVVEDVKDKFKGSSSSSQSSSSSSAARTVKGVLPAYMRSHVIARTGAAEYRDLLNTSLNLFLDTITAKELFEFKPYHKAIREPTDLYTWGNNFFRPLVKFRNSMTMGLEHVAEIKRLIQAGENVMLLANHQTEVDPQVLSLLLEQEGMEDLAESCIFVAGHKVTTDPVAVPFSMGRNLLTIVSKKYLDGFPPAEKEAKAARNQETVGEMRRLFKEGGHLFWVAPSGGRDRRSPESGIFEPAAFDEASVRLFLLLAQKAQKGGAPTHFFPLAMWTHRMVPPPEGQKAKVGEERSFRRSSVAVEFGPELDVKALGGTKKFPPAAEKAVRDQYFHLHSLMESRS